MSSLFLPISKSEWIQQIKKDLKGKSLDSKDWKINDMLSIPVFNYPTDYINRIDHAIYQSDYSPSWNISESFIDIEETELNSAILSALSRGTQNIILPLSFISYNELFSEAIKNVDTNFISVEFFSEKINDITTAINQLKARKSNFDLLINYSFSWHKDINELEVSSYLDSIQNHSIEQKTKHIISISSFESEEVLTELSNILNQLTVWSSVCNEKKIDFEEIYSCIRIKLKMEDRYFVNIAKIRALKILLKNWSHMHFGKEGALPLINATIEEKDYTDNNIPLISMTWKTMAAVIAGVDEIIIRPVQNDYSSRNTARNIHHIIAEESRLNDVHDPAAGSYIIEDATIEISRKSWSHFYNNLKIYE